jgi:glutamate/aspartate transport system permease protein
MKYNWNWGILFEVSPEGKGTYLDMLLSGLVWTLTTAFFAWIVALVLGVCIGVMRTLPNRIGRGFGASYVELFRNIPLLVQLFLWYFVMPELVPQEMGNWLKQLPNAAFYTAVIGLGLFMSARVAEQVRTGILSLPKGQMMAATALGMTTAQTYRYILLPIVFRVILPPLTSELLNTIKNTSVALTIGLMELTARARSMQEFSFQVFEAFTVATILYLITNIVVTFAMRKLEKSVAVPGYLGVPANAVVH